MTPTESRKVWDIEQAIERRHRRGHWYRVLNVAGLISFGLMALWLLAEAITAVAGVQ